jgi:outer membrane receptor protein involved in Fe transport
MDLATALLLFALSSQEPPAAPTQHSALSTQHSEKSTQHPITAQDSITVTATKTNTRLSDTPASVVVLNRDAIASSPAATVDDMLRQVPGFTLFRRSGSRSANPTSQGVSLRGIGASGASRALVLDDGIPLNDPFGGWVYWGRVPRAALERIEVVRGGESELYGSSAMGGVVQFIRRPSTTDAIVLETSAGSQSTGTASLFAAVKRNAWSGSVAADWLSTAGYILVADDQRGRVDREADADHRALDFTLSRALDEDNARAFVRASHFDESRNNGTPLQVNDTTTRQLALGADLRALGGSVALRAYGSDQDYTQTFSAIAADRNSERLTVLQSVPSKGSGASVQLARAFGMRNAVVAGAELHEVRGTSDEENIAVNGTHTFASNGGTQRTSSAYAEDVFAMNARTSITAGLRFDSLRGDEAWSPRLSLLHRATSDLAFTASAYRAFRAPTLNELYRGFRVGNVVTQANAALTAERLSAIEAGVRYRWLRVNAFSMTIDDTIANVTLSTTPSLITRRRQNLGSSRSRGVEVEGDWLLGNRWRASAGWLFSDATASGGKRTPQVPRNQATAQLAYSQSRWRGGVQTRWSSMQFDDDLNQLPLRSYFAADVFASATLVAHLDATLSVENLFDRRIEVSATPVITLAQPRSVRLGVRWTH